MEASDIRYLIVHCSASPPNAKVNAAVIDRWHRERGFRKIGYHYVINRNGAVELGRKLDEAGAHVEGYNGCSIGICLVGGVDASMQMKPEDNFTVEQKKVLQQTLLNLLTKFPKAEILGHRDIPGVKKACPSFDVKAWWAALSAS